MPQEERQQVLRASYEKNLGFFKPLLFYIPTDIFIDMIGCLCFLDDNPGKGVGGHEVDRDTDRTKLALS